MSVYDIEKHPIHLGLGATAEVEPALTGDMRWYEDYVERHVDDGGEGRLVSMHSFSQSWDMWEVHPRGSEVVLCVSGAITLLQQRPDGAMTRITIGPGQYAVNAPGVWHTADIHEPTTALFITSGLGTEHRPR